MCPWSLPVHVDHLLIVVDDVAASPTSSSPGRRRMANSAEDLGWVRPRVRMVPPAVVDVTVASKWLEGSHSGLQDVHSPVAIAQNPSQYSSFLQLSSSIVLSAPAHDVISVRGMRVAFPHVSELSFRLHRGRCPLRGSILCLPLGLQLRCLLVLVTPQTGRPCRPFIWQRVKVWGIRAIEVDYCLSRRGAFV